MSATYVLLGVSVASAALLVVNILASAMVMGATVLVVVRGRSGIQNVATSFRARRSSERAMFLFLLRISPGLIAIAIVVAVCVPSYLKYEPGYTAERIGPLLALLAITALSLGFCAMWRTVACWRATRKVVQHWLRVATPLDLGARRISSWRFPAYSFPHSFPVVAVLGTVRPVLFISEVVIEALSDEELGAAVEHELAHVATGDNLRRVVMRAASDVFGLSSLAGYLDRLWAEASESAADEAVARRGGAAALDLAAALIQISRLIPAGTTPALPVAAVGAFLIAPANARGDAPAGVASRIKWLIEIADTLPDRNSLAAGCGASQRLFPHAGGRIPSAIFRVALLGGISSIFALSSGAVAPRALRETHLLIEQVLHRLD